MLLPNQTIVVVLLVLLSYFFWAPLLPRYILLEVINGILVATCVTVTAIYARGFWVAMRKSSHELQGGHVLVLGIVLFFVCIDALFIWTWAFALLDRPAWMQMHLANYFFRWGALVASILLMVATNVGEARILPGVSQWRIAMVTALGLTVALLAVRFLKEEPAPLGPVYHPQYYNPLPLPRVRD